MRHAGFIHAAFLFPLFLFISCKNESKLISPSSVPSNFSNLDSDGEYSGEETNQEFYGTPVNCFSITCKYITPNGTGAKNGSNWANAYAGIPTTFIRGATYFISGGNYQKFTFDTQPSGTLAVTLKKAILEDHGSDIGWVDNYGYQQAVFQGNDNFIISQSYFILDGSSRNYDWKSGYGIKIKNAAITQSTGIKIFSGAGVSTDVTIANVEIEGLGMDNSIFDRGLEILAAENIRLQNLYIHDLGSEMLTSGNNNGIIIERSVLARNSSESSQPVQAIGDENSDNVIIRNNFFEDIEGRGAIVVFLRENIESANNWEIYNNVFFSSHENPYERTGYENGFIAILNDQNVSNWNIYQNSIVNIHESSARASFAGAASSNDVNLQNNLWYNCKNAHHSGLINISHNFYSLTTYTIGELNVENSSLDPFRDWIYNDFRLAIATDPGQNLGVSYNADLDGVERGSDGAWDRGAYEY